MSPQPPISLPWLLNCAKPAPMATAIAHNSAKMRKSALIRSMPKFWHEKRERFKNVYEFVLFGSFFGSKLLSKSIQSTEISCRMQKMIMLRYGMWLVALYARREFGWSPSSFATSLSNTLRSYFGETMSFTRSTISLNGTTTDS